MKNQDVNNIADHPNKTLTMALLTDPLRETSQKRPVDLTKVPRVAADRARWRPLQSPQAGKSECT